MNECGAIPVSVIVMTRNEAENIGSCLVALKDFDQVFVVDSGSEDGTVDIARQHGAQVVAFTWNGRYPKKKQWCLDNLPFSYQYVLYVDADERIPPELAGEIWTAVARADFAGWFIGLDYVWLGRVLRHGMTMYKLALFERRHGQFVEWDDLDASRMWEVEGHYQPTIKGPTATLSSRLLHDDQDRLYEWFERHNRYSDWEALVRVNGAALVGAETQSRSRQIAKRMLVRLPGKPFIVLAYTLLLRGAWRDGWQGVHYAIAKAVYQWQIELKVNELRRRGPDSARSK